MNENEIYEKLRKNLINELSLFDEEELLTEIDKARFSENIIYHSKSLAYNYSPFYKELSGSSLDVLKNGAPRKFENNYVYFGDSSIQKIERYGKTGKLSGVDYIFDEENKRKVISVDNFNEVEKFIKVLFEDGLPRESYKIDSSDNGIATLYIYSKEKILKSISFAMIDGLPIKNEVTYHYDDDGSLNSIFSIANNQTGIVYQK